MGTSTVFKTAEGREKIRAYYNNVLSHFPFGQKYVETGFGKTFVLEAGAKENPAVILLHGSCSNSAFWFGEITALAAYYHIYAVDIIGEAGNSEESRPKLLSDDYALWLGDVMDALELQTACIIGNSLGSWLALKFSITFPARVSKLILLAATGIAPLNSEFLSNAVNSIQQNETPTVDPSISGGRALPQAVQDFINLILENYNPITEDLPVFSDEQFKALIMPVLFIAGEKDIIIDADASARRLRALLPSAEVHLLENCGHVVMNAMEYILPFLGTGK